MPLQASWGYVVIGPSALLYSTDATYRLRWIFLNLPTNIVAIGIENAILHHCLPPPSFLSPPHGHHHNDVAPGQNGCSQFLTGLSVISIPDQW